MKYIAFLFLITWFYPAQGQSSQNRIEKRHAEKACEMITRLPEVIKADNYCKKLSKGKRHLVTFIGGDPDADDHSFLIKVAEDNGGAYHAWFLFTYNPKTQKIWFYDPAKDEYISLQKWRKNYRAYM